MSVEPYDETNPITPGQLSDWVVEVAKDLTDKTKVEYKRLRGITEFTPPAVEKNLEDDGDYDMGSWASQTATGLTWTSEGTVKIPRGGMPSDPGQEILKAAGLGVAEEGYVLFRCYNKKTGTGWKGIADASLTSNGGPKTDLTTAAFKLTGRGPLHSYVKDMSASAPDVAPQGDPDSPESPASQDATNSTDKPAANAPDKSKSK
ncbi:phage tail tube protein [Acaricomes phytoseiuli]|uniref:phage tail tube protein n=1 Tax=Acaricomes phytoseiuli TaxID=291968 RepID=UPI000368A3B3|nr:hypothetical protein [Acaricomes phytoseiuli]